MISRVFLDIMPHMYDSKNFSGYNDLEKPPKKLLEQVKVTSPELGLGA